MESIYQFNIMHINEKGVITESFDYIVSDKDAQPIITSIQESNKTMIREQLLNILNEATSLHKKDSSKSVDYLLNKLDDIAHLNR